MSTAEVASRLPVGRDRTLDLLHELKNKGEIRSKEVGANGLIWWVRPKHPSQAPPASEDGEVESDRDRLQVEKNIVANDLEVVGQIKNLDIPGTDSVRELRQIAIQWACYYVINKHNTSLDSATDYVLSRYPGGYQYRRTEMKDLLRGSFSRLSFIEIKQDGTVRYSGHKKDRDRYSGVAWKKS
ncbi:hypothetical protein [Haloferax marisrubri]|uniref:hypothetical protein n=1 Tax=Haloferax marisrubri TaxID=1544719 RepID=UPI0011AF7C71|nr:hypothetical protein [Haloferax marisrubri]